MGLISLIALIALGLAAGPLPVAAQQPEKVYRVGVLRWARSNAPEGLTW